MNSETIKTRLWRMGDPSPETHPAWAAFEKEMRNKDYGYDALHQAWAFFRAGWGARENLAFA